MKRPFLYFIFIIAFFHCEAQKLKRDEKTIVSHLQQEIRYLSDDKMEGRRTGTEGEKKAAEYIASKFSEYQIAPGGTNGYYQPFTINEGKKPGEKSSFYIDHNKLLLFIDYFPLSFSANGNIEGSASISLKEPGTPWFLDLKDIMEENRQNPHFDILDYISTKSAEWQKKGATALLVFNSDKAAEPLHYSQEVNSVISSIPVIYIMRNSLKYLADETATLEIQLKTELIDQKRNATNVIGYIDNKAPLTVVVGAHFDHLGHGEDGNGLDQRKNEIYNGADDNASGTAALIELARMIRSSSLRKTNFLFIAFSGEELGLLGSKYFVNHPTINLNQVDYMINLDMIGRLNDSSRIITVGGFGTSSEWSNLYSENNMHKLFTDGLKFKFDSSGAGPSDHTSFYLQDIPVLYYFTGMHPDYHRTTDDFDKINYTGEMFLLKHIYSVIQKEEKQTDKIAFSKTKDNLFATPSFTVTLGIMPDYSFSGDGVRIDAISENRPAQKGGLKTGDIIIALGEYKVHSLNSYMEGLAKFKKGEKTIVEFYRDRKKLSTEVVF
jgi:aminopeptidase YwaD